MKLTKFLLGIAPAIVLALLQPAPTHAGRGTAPALRQTTDGGRIAVPPSDRDLNVYQRGLIDRYLAGAAQAELDTLRIIAFQVQFQDTVMGGQPGGRSEVRDSTWFAGELEHMTDYFRGASRGRLEIEWTLDGNLYTLPRAMGYYGRDTFEETRVVELVEDVIELADGTTDFAAYDHVFVIHAGAGQETDLAGDSRVQIWSSFYDAGDIDAAFPDTTVAGLATNDSLGGEPFVVDNFSIVPANSSQDFTIIGTLGVWVFEVASRVGLLPLFDSTPAGFSDGQGVGSFCVMSFGLFNVNGFIPSFPCAFNRILAGWLSPVTIQPQAGATELRLTDVNTGAETDTLCAKVPITENEYYLVVNRVHDANFDSLFTFVDLDSNLVPDNSDSLGGAEFDFFMTDVTNPAVRRFLPEYGFEVLLRHTGSGVYIWHVDERVVFETLAAGFLPNDFVERKAVDLEEADGVQDMDGIGVPAFTLGSFFDSYRSGDGNQNAFGPETDPGSYSNAGVRTGIVIEDISEPGHVMTATLRLDAGHSDDRVRWAASAPSQPGTVADLDGAGASEIAVLAAGGQVYLFDETGAEYDDVDADPATIAPYITAAGERWVGPPAVASFDATPQHQLVAAAESGRLYAWNADGTEFVDGDTNPATDGVLYDAGRPIAAPPLVVDLLDDGSDDVVVVERDGDSLRVAFVAANGTAFTPSEDAFEPLWPVVVAGHYAAPVAWAGTANKYSPAKEGIVLACVDTLASRVRIKYVPARHVVGVLVGEPVAQTWTASFPVPPGADPAGFVVSAPAVGDIDADGSDEVVITTRDGRLFIYENDAGEIGGVDPEVIQLRAGNPSAPALGDTDRDGTLEIALWDEEYLYLLESNGRPVTEWPKAIVPASVEELPPSTIRRGLESPVIADLDGDGTIEALFPLTDGTLRAFSHDGEPTPGFPRVGPAGAAVTPSVADLDGGGELSLVVVGSAARLAGVNTVVDTFATAAEATLSIQSLPGSQAGVGEYWPAYRVGVARSGRVEESVPLKSADATVEAGSFMIYPNPVAGSVVNVRVTLNAAATVHLEVYNLEGEELIARTFEANVNGLVGTPLDEGIDVSSLVTGVYFVRLRIEGASEALIKPFAIKR